MNYLSCEIVNYLSCEMGICLAASPAAHLTSSGDLLPKIKAKHQQNINFLEFDFLLYEYSILGNVEKLYWV